MSIWSTLIGGVTGAALLGGPIGALVGAVAAHYAAQHFGPKVEDQTQQITFTIGVIVLSAKMAKADGTVSREEVDVFKRAFQVPDSEVKNVGRIFDQAKQDSAGFEPYARQLAGLFRAEPAVLEQLLDILFHIALADHVMHEKERAFLEEVAQIFGFSKHEFDAIRERYMGPDESDPYVILGVERTAVKAEIKSSYRTLIKEHHPDRLMAQGMPEEFIKVATEKLAIINLAYDQICKERGIK